MQGLDIGEIIRFVAADYGVEKNTAGNWHRNRASDARRRDKSRWRDFFSPSLTPKGTQRDFSASVGPARWGEAMT